MNAAIPPRLRNPVPRVAMIAGIVLAGFLLAAGGGIPMAARLALVISAGGAAAFWAVKTGPSPGRVALIGGALGMILTFFVRSAAPEADLLLLRYVWSEGGGNLVVESLNALVHGVLIAMVAVLFAALLARRDKRMAS